MRKQGQCTHGAVSTLEAVEAGLQVSIVDFGRNYTLHRFVGIGPELVMLLAEQKDSTGGLPSKSGCV